MSRRGSIKLICANDKCINKSIVYRHENYVQDFNCKLCGSQLRLVTNKYVENKRILAKKELGLIPLD